MTLLWICFGLVATIFSVMFLLVGHQIDKLRAEIRILQNRDSFAKVNDHARDLEISAMQKDITRLKEDSRRQHPYFPTNRKSGM